MQSHRHLFSMSIREQSVQMRKISPQIKWDWLPQNLLPMCYQDLLTHYYQHCIKMNLTAQFLESYLTCHSWLLMDATGRDDVTNHTL